MRADTRAQFSVARRGTPAWVLAADHETARLYVAAGPRAALECVATLRNPDARARERELHRYSRGRQASAATTRSGPSARRDSGRKFTTNSFTARIARRLETERAGGKLSRLYLVADPEVLGLLRKNLSPATARLVERSVPRNVMHEGSEDVRDVLPERL